MQHAATEKPLGEVQCHFDTPANPQQLFWWERANLHYTPSGILSFGGILLPNLVNNRQLQNLPSQPVYVYHLNRIREKVAMLRAALPAATLLYAIKANRCPAVLQEMSPLVDGIDVCSPNEAVLALQYGFAPHQLSYTGTSLAPSDLKFLADHPEIHVNADSLSQLRRLVLARPNQPIGIRINPEQGIGYRNETRLVYTPSDRPSKFGILREQIPDALQMAASAGCIIDTVHWHLGCGWLAPQLPNLFHILDTTFRWVDELPHVQHVNLGGGLGVPFRQDDVPFPLEEWAAGIQQRAGRYQITIEPGSFLVQDAGILLTQVNTVEQKRDRFFVGVQAGFNLLMEPVFYQMPCEPVFLQQPESGRKKGLITLVGNINEAHDLFVQDYWMPIPEEGEWFGFLNAGAYGSSMSSQHCLRGDFSEVAV